MKAFGIWTTGIAALALVGGIARADVLTLKSGRILEGTVKETETGYSFMAPYATVTFAKEDVASVAYGPSPLQVFRQRAAEVAETDVDGHYRLGLYAEDKGLGVEAAKEFEKVLALDPEHEGARIKLGFVREGDRWVSRDEAMARQGLVKYKGRYVTAEEAEEFKARDESLGRVREMRALVKVLADTIESSTGVAKQDAVDKLSGMSDPAALDALMGVIESRGVDVRSPALAALGNYREDEAALAAFDVAMTDPNSSLRHQARALLNKKQNEAALDAALSSLSLDNDATRFRASEVLGAIGDARAIPYLIEYLYWLRQTAPAPTARSRSNEPARGLRSYGPTYIAGFRAKVAPGVVAHEPIIGGFDRYGRRIILNPEEPYVESWGDYSTDLPDRVLNYEGLQALQVMTGQDYRFDKDAWRAWYLANAAKLREGQRGAIMPR